MLKLRQLHRYLGVFFTPAILFFAFTGALQTFGLHEAERHGEPPPYPWIAAMASLHKDQHLPKSTPRASAPASAPAPVPAPAPAAAAAKAGPEDEEHDGHAADGAKGEHPAQKSPLPLKLFVLALAVALCLSSLTGLYIALSNPRTRVAVGLTLGAGMLLPLLLLLA